MDITDVNRATKIARLYQFEEDLVDLQDALRERYGKDDPLASCLAIVRTKMEAMREAVATKDEDARYEIAHEIMGGLEIASRIAHGLDLN